MKNCSTTRRIENFKQFNLLSKSFFAQFHRKSIDRDLESEERDAEGNQIWPVVPGLLEFLGSLKTQNARLTFQLVD